MDMLFFVQDSAAPPAGGGGGAQPPGGSFLGMLPMLAMMFLVMYFLVMRPQSKQRKERDEMIKNLKKNDKVLTNAGIYGIVKQITADDPDLTLCIDERKDVCIRVSKQSIANLVKASGSPEPEAKAETTEKKS
jgi:preprotein translocase subunit YajC